MRLMNSILSIAFISSLTACGGNGTNISAGQEAFAYESAEDVILNEGNFENSPIHLNTYSDIEILTSDSDVHIDSNANWMQLTFGDQGDIQNTRVYLSDNPKTLFLQLAGSNTELHFLDAGIISNFTQITGDSNTLIMPANSSIQFDDYYTERNEFEVNGNGHTLKFGADSRIDGVKIKLMQANDKAHIICAPKDWIDNKDTYFEDTTIISTVYNVVGTDC